MKALATLAFSSLAALSSLPAVAASSSFYFDDASVSSSGQQITVVRLPVRLPNGDIVYKDVTLTFQADATGKVTVKTQKTETSPKQFLVVGTLVAGTYHDIADDLVQVKVVGPQQGQNGRAMWTIRNATNQTLFRFYAGPVKGHPYETAILRSKVTGSFMWGKAEHSASFKEHWFQAGNLVGLQVNADNQVSVYNFGGMSAPESTPYGFMTIQK